MPKFNVIFILFPAQKHFFAAEDRGKIDQPAIQQEQPAHDDVEDGAHQEGRHRAREEGARALAGNTRGPDDCRRQRVPRSW